MADEPLASAPSANDRIREALAAPLDIGSESWLRERFPDKDWHRHRRTDGRTDLCDGTPSDCTTKVRLP